MKNKIRNLQILFVSNALVWICLAALWLFRIDKYSGSEYIVYFNSSAMAVNSFIMLSIAYFIPRRSKVIYWFSVIYIIANIILTIADQFGFYDFIILIFEMTILYYLARNKPYYDRSRMKL